MLGIAKISKKDIQEALNPKELNVALGRFYILEVLLFLLIFILYSSQLQIIKNLREDYILYLSIGLLTFIAIFYSLLTQKDVIEKLDNIWIDMSIYEKKEIEKYKRGRKQAEKIQLADEFERKHKPPLEFIKTTKAMLKLELFLYLTVLFLILSSFLVEFSVSISFFFLILGSLGVFHIVTVWLFLTSEQIRRVFSKNGGKKK